MSTKTKETLTVISQEEIGREAVVGRLLPLGIRLHALAVLRSAFFPQRDRTVSILWIVSTRAASLLESCHVNAHARVIQLCCLASY